MSQELHMNEKSLLDKTAGKNHHYLVFSFYFVIFSLQIIDESLIDCGEELFLVLITSTGVPQGSLLGLFLDSSLFTSRRFSCCSETCNTLPLLSIL